MIYTERVGNVIQRTTKRRGAARQGSSIVGFADVFDKSVLAPGGRAVTVFPLFGQSNIAGFGSTTAPRVYANTRVFYKTDETSTDFDGELQVYEFDVNTTSENLSGGTQDRPNPAIFIADELESLYADELDLVVVQTAIGSTGFENGSGRWAPGGDLREAFIDHYLMAALNTLWAAGYRDIRLAPIMCNLGEQDSLSQASSLSYGQYLTDMVNEVRERVGNVGFVQGRVNINLPRTYRNNVRAGQQQATLDLGNSVMLDYDSLPMAGDNTHYTVSGYDAMASLYVQAAISLGTVQWKPSSALSTFSVSAPSTTAISVAVNALSHGSVRMSAVPPNAPDRLNDKAYTDFALGDVATVAESNLKPGTEYDVYVDIRDKSGASFPVKVRKSTLSQGSEPQFGAITEAYVAAVELEGGSVSALAKAAIDTFIYSTYDNGNSSVGSVADFIDKFLFLWAPVSDFAGVVVPIVGSNFTNSGFVTGDYDVKTGLTGDGGSYLDTGVIVTNAQQASNSFGVFTVGAVAPSTGLIGSRNGSSQACIIFVNSGSSLVTRNFSNGDNRILAYQEGFVCSLRDGGSSGDFVLDDLSSNSFSSTPTSAPGNSTYLFAWNGGSGPVLPTTMTLSAGWECSEFLTNEELTVLRNALNALQTARGAL
jgi:hypothetical protein